MIDKNEITRLLQVKNYELLYFYINMMFNNGKKCYFCTHENNYRRI